MIRKSTLLAVAASAALGLAMLAPTAASAHGGGGGHGGGGFHGGGGHGGGGFHGGGYHGGRGHIGFRHYHPRWHVRYHRPIWYGVRPVYTAYSARVVTAGPCTCLSKEYTPEGAVLFKDRCTNEAAMNPPAAAPQQTGDLEPQEQQQQQQQYSQQYVQPQPK
jgi:hypothetical protein